MTANLPAHRDEHAPAPVIAPPAAGLPPLPALFADLPPSQAGDDQRRQAYMALGHAAYLDWLALCAGGVQCTVCWRWFTPAMLPQHRAQSHGLLQRAKAWLGTIG